MVQSNSHVLLGSGRICVMASDGAFCEGFCYLITYHSMDALISSLGSWEWLLISSGSSWGTGTHLQPSTSKEHTWDSRNSISTLQGRFSFYFWYLHFS
jgi:hypothetical protein